MAGARETQFLIYTRRRLRDVALCAHARTDARPAHALKCCRIASTAKSLPAGVCVVIDVKSALARDVWRAPRPPPALSLSAHGRRGVQQIACMSHGFVWNAREAKRRPFALQTFSGRAPPRKTLRRIVCAENVRLLRRIRGICRHGLVLTLSNLSLFFTCCAQKRDPSIVFSISRMYGALSYVGLMSAPSAPPQHVAPRAPN